MNYRVRDTGSFPRWALEKEYRPDDWWNVGFFAFKYFAVKRGKLLANGGNIVWTSERAAETQEVKHE